WPNAVRVFVGDTLEPAESDRVAMLETNLDDMNPQGYDLLIERLLARGALDVTLTPVIMKRGRPGIVLSVLADPAKVEPVLKVLFGGAAVFTNAVEWLGRRLGISDGAIGSILAGIATALPETLIPVIAIFWGTSQAETDIGIGAILGAPLMLGTLVLPLLAGFLLFLERMGKRSGDFELDYHAVRHDLSFFLVAYGLALLVAVNPLAPVRYVAAVWLLAAYVWFVKVHLASGEVSQVELDPLYFWRRAGRPATALIVTQVLVGLGLLIGGAHLFVHVVKDAA